MGLVEVESKISSLIGESVKVIGTQDYANSIYNFCKHKNIPIDFNATTSVQDFIKNRHSKFDFNISEEHQSRILEFSRIKIIGRTANTESLHLKSTPHPLENNILPIYLNGDKKKTSLGISNHLETDFLGDYSEKDPRCVSLCKSGDYFVESLRHYIRDCLNKSSRILAHIGDNIETDGLLAQKLGINFVHTTYEEFSNHSIPLAKI